MKLVVDMNLSPEWVKVLVEAGWETIHWSKVGDFHATDIEIMAWAKRNGYVVFTHDLTLAQRWRSRRRRDPASFKFVRRM